MIETARVTCQSCNSTDLIERHSSSYPNDITSAPEAKMRSSNPEIRFKWDGEGLVSGARLGTHPGRWFLVDDSAHVQPHGSIAVPDPVVCEDVRRSGGEEGGL